MTFESSHQSRRKQVEFPFVLFVNVNVHSLTLGPSNVGNDILFQIGSEGFKCALQRRTSCFWWPRVESIQALLYFVVLA